MLQSTELAAVIVAAGDGNRLGRLEGKALAPLAGRPLFMYALATLFGLPSLDRVVLVIRQQDRRQVEAAVSRFLPSALASGRFCFADGGETRRESVANGLAQLARTLDCEADPVVLVHDAARPLVCATMCEAVAEAVRAGATAVAPAIPVNDALRTPGGPLTQGPPLRAVQTPQGSRLRFLMCAHALAAQTDGRELRDDLAVCEAAGAVPVLLEGDPRNLKVTNPGDLVAAEAMLKAQLLPRTGIGYDIHPLAVAPGGAVRLAGASIPAGLVLQGHSDADVAVHALIDALLGAVGAGDIGQWFPPGAPEWRGANSLDLLQTVWSEMARRGVVFGNADISIQAERPRLSPHYPVMREALAKVLSCDPAMVSVKATTAERLGAIGRGEGIAAAATALLFAPAGDLGLRHGPAEQQP